MCKISIGSSLQLEIVVSQWLETLINKFISDFFYSSWLPSGGLVFVNQHCQVEHKDTKVTSKLPLIKTTSDCIKTDNYSEYMGEKNHCALEKTEILQHIYVYSNERS